MAKINHIEMGEDVMALNDVQVKKGFMGWSVKLIYKPTHSKIQIKEKEYTAEDGKKLENILTAAPAEVETAISKFPVSAISMGNFKLQACLSDDSQFAALQLLAYKDFGYKPVTLPPATSAVGTPVQTWLLAHPEKALLDLLYLYPFYDSEAELEQLRLDEYFMTEELDTYRLTEYLSKIGCRALDSRVKKLLKIYGI